MGGDVVLRKRQEKKVENEARKAEALNQQLRDTNRTMKEQLDQSKATLDGITQGGATMKKIAGKLDDMDEVRTFTLRALRASRYGAGYLVVDKMLRACSTA